MHSLDISPGTSHNVFRTTSTKLPSLLVDGYVSHAYQSGRAEEYFLNLLKGNFLSSVEALSFPDRESHFFVVGPITQDVPRQLEPFDPSSGLLDRAVVSRGSVVPQEM